MKSSPFIDIFCRVIDNYGDIGVCWRLAKDLNDMLNRYYTHNRQNTEQQSSLVFDPKQATYPSSHLGFHPNSLIQQYFQPTKHKPPFIRLWVDDLESFAKIEPILKNRLLLSQKTQATHSLTHEVIKSSNTSTASITPTCACYDVKGIEIIHWTPKSTQALRPSPAPIVIEAFGTNLDEPLIQAMKDNTQCWFNLEYLSAEKWVDDFHGQASPQKNGVPKYFFFPGFTSQTGGLIREEQLLPQLDNFSHQIQWLEKNIHPDSAQAYKDGARFIHIFCYPSAPFTSLVEALIEIYQEDQRPTVLLMADGVLKNAETSLSDLLTKYKRETLTADIRLQRFSFIPQEEFDYLLHIADFNIIRGEDSFVRAIWSAKPFLWHIYEQEENTHFEKLNAWLATHHNPLATLQRHWNLYAAWNNPTIKPASVEEASHAKAELHQALVKQWKILFSPSYKAQWQEIQHFYHIYRENLLKNSTLSFNLLNFQAKHS